MRNKAKTPRAVLKQRIENVCHLAVRTRAKRNGATCPIKPGEPITLAYHIVRKGRGDALRYEPQNIIGASLAANAGELYHPARYREIHVRMFGLELIEKLEARGRQIIKFYMDDLRLILSFWQHRLEFALMDTMPANPYEDELRSRGLIL